MDETQDKAAQILANLIAEQVKAMPEDQALLQRFLEEVDRQDKEKSQETEALRVLLERKFEES